MAMYVAFAIIILLYNLMYSANILFKKNLQIGMICFFVLYTYHLSSKAGLITLLLTLVLFVLLTPREKPKALYKVFLILTIITSFIIVFKTNTRMQAMKKDIAKLDTKIIDNTSSSNLRLKVFKSSVFMIRNNFLFGVGTGDVQDELNKYYKSANYNEDFLEQNLNAHNEIFQTVMTLGLPGIISLLSIFVFGFWKALKSKKVLLFFFLVIVLSNLAFESMLKRQAGVIFFVFFMYFLLAVGDEKHTDTEATTQ